jgi:hypothetical protein
LLLLFGEFLLAFGEFFEAFDGLVDFAFALGAGSAAEGALGGLVLVLFGVEFEVEEAFEVALLAAAATTAAALLTEGDLNLAEDGFSAEDVLEGLLFGGEGLAPALIAELCGGGEHGFGGEFHFAAEGLELFVGAGEIAALHPLGEREGLLAELGLDAGEEFGVLAKGGGGFFVRIWLKVALMISFWRWEIWAGCSPPPPASPPPPVWPWLNSFSKGWASMKNMSERVVVRASRAEA